MKSMFEHRWAWAAGLAVVTLVACQSAPAEHQDEAGAGAPIDARLARVSLVEWPSTSEAGGVVRAGQTAVISSRVVAPVTQVFVNAGDRVRRGQTLVVLDGRELEAQAARASAAAAGAALGLDAARAEMAAAESALVLARAIFDRIYGLHDKQSATAQELDQATAARAGAEARVAGARARVAEAEQGILAARAAADAAGVSVSYTRLTSPFDGIVASRQADAGSLASPGAPLLTVDDTSRYRLEARIDESQARDATAGAEVDVRLDGPARAAGTWRRATIGEIASVDPERHSFLVKIDLPAADDLRSGQFGRVRLRGPSHQVLAAPRGAVVRRGQLAFAYAIDAEGRARLRMVSTGESSGDQVEVLAGLADGDQVVLNPPDGLDDGRPVRGAEPGPAGAAK